MEATGMWRSRDMRFVRLLMPLEVAHTFLDVVGQREIMQFDDLNENLQTFQLEYVRQLIAVNEARRDLEAIEYSLEEMEVSIDEDVYLEESLTTERDILDTVEKVEATSRNLEAEVSIVRELRQKYDAEKELQDVLRNAAFFLGRHDIAIDMNKESGRPAFDESAALLQEVVVEERERRGQGMDVELNFIAGVIPPHKRTVFERQVFLTSRGNAITLFSSEESPDAKMVFVVFFSAGFLKKKLSKLCHVMSLNILMTEEDEGNIRETMQASVQREMDVQRTLFQSETSLRRSMEEVANAFPMWTRTIHRARGIYATLNRFRLNTYTKIMQAEGWVISEQEQSIRNALHDALDLKGYSGAENPIVVETFDASSVTHAKAPTCFKTNKFTEMYQSIIDTYGVPRYKEINPGLFTCVTFPFLYGMMYGDIFHGGLLFLASLFMIFKEDALKKQKLNEFVSAAFQGRYLLVLMGFFGFYCGFIYNDFASISLPIFGQSFSKVFKDEVWTDAVHKSVYSFGVDSIWYESDQKLSFLNSLKMKLSVIVGVTQMTVGVFLFLFNQLFFGDYVSIICEFIPMLLFLLSFFGYMCIMIIIKWCTDWTGKQPPNLISSLIKMFLNPGTVADEDLLYEGQAQVQLYLLFAAMASVPWLLLAKPIYILVQRCLNRRYNSLHLDEYDEYEAEYPLGEPLVESANDMDTEESPSHEGFADIMVHQVIHTIEYVLGTISNTASYLRLWALSLAHAQLADVFFGKLLLGFSGSSYMLVVGFAAFISVTFAVLMCMDVLECFLHALRLHWVEFQNKFFYGDGIAYRPFSHNNKEE